MTADAPATGDVLAVFAKAPRAGEVKTRLSPSLTPEQAARLQGALIADSLALAQQVADCSVRLVVNDVADPVLRSLARDAGVPLLAQGSGDLGERIERTLTRTLAEGFRAAAILGSDSPTLPPRWIRRALDRLADVDVVLGRAADGGYWMIGARRVAAGMCSGISWDSAQVLEQSTARLRALGLSCQLGRLWYDVDRPADLLRLRAELGRRPVAPATREILATF